MAPTDPTIALLQGIRDDVRGLRDEVRQANARLDAAQPRPAPNFAAATDIRPTASQLHLSEAVAMLARSIDDLRDLATAGSTTTEPRPRVDQD